MAPRPPCGRPTPDGPCPEDRTAGKQTCVWHWLEKQDPQTQAANAQARLVAAMAAEAYEPRARVPKADWLPGKRWCSGCQWFVPLFYAQGSRCRACNGAAAHAAHIEKTYGITPEQYDAMYKLQGGRCYICRRKTQKRLAVDHDHDTGKVRGLLCASNEWGCNHAVLGVLAAGEGGALETARRVVSYLERPPFDRVVAGEGPPPPPGQGFTLGERMIGLDLTSQPASRSEGLDPGPGVVTPDWW